MFPKYKHFLAHMCESILRHRLCAWKTGLRAFILLCFHLFPFCFLTIMLTRFFRVSKKMRAYMLTRKMGESRLYFLYKFFGCFLDIFYKPKKAQKSPKKIMVSFLIFLKVFLKVYGLTVSFSVFYVTIERLFIFGHF